ncbi:MAG: hypothetical protein AAB553_04325 [Patescibacteria group bacterium]
MAATEKGVFSEKFPTRPQDPAEGVRRQKLEEAYSQVDTFLNEATIDSPHINVAMSLMTELVEEATMANLQRFESGIDETGVLASIQLSPQRMPEETKKPENLLARRFYAIIATVESPELALYRTDHTAGDRILQVLAGRKRIAAKIGERGGNILITAGKLFSKLPPKKSQPSS